MILYNVFNRDHCLFVAFSFPDRDGDATNFAIELIDWAKLFVNFPVVIVILGVVTIY